MLNGMISRIRIIFLKEILPAILVLVFISATGYAGSIMIGRNSDSFPGPYLLSPVTDDIALNGQEVMEFKWERTDLPLTDHFNFKIYKGYCTFADNLIYKEDVSIDKYPITVPASLLEENQVYTWVLIQVYIDGRKTDKSFSSFKIIKK